MDSHEFKRLIAEKIDVTLEDLNKLLNDRKPRLINTSNITVGNETVNGNICSACYKVIEEEWDHREWCELYAPHPLVEFLDEGSK